MVKIGFGKKDPQGKDIPRVKVCGIYMIASSIGRMYIGQSIDIYSRWRNYIQRTDSKPQKRLYRSLKKHGIENHEFKILCECEKDQLNYLEKYLIAFYDTFNTKHGLNLTQGGHSPMTEATKKKVSKRLMGIPQSKEANASQKKTWAKKRENGEIIFTIEHRKGLSESNRRRVVSEKVLSIFKKNWKPKEKGWKMSNKGKTNIKLGWIYRKDKMNKEKEIFKSLSKSEQYTIICTLLIAQIFSKKKKPQKLIEIYNSHEKQQSKKYERP